MIFQFEKETSNGQPAITRIAPYDTDTAADLGQMLLGPLFGILVGNSNIHGLVLARIGTKVTYPNGQVVKPLCTGQFDDMYDFPTVGSYAEIEVRGLQFAFWCDPKRKPDRQFFLASKDVLEVMVCGIHIDPDGEIKSTELQRAFGASILSPEDFEVMSKAMMDETASITAVVKLPEQCLVLEGLTSLSSTLFAINGENSFVVSYGSEETQCVQRFEIFGNGTLLLAM